MGLLHIYSRPRLSRQPSEYNTLNVPPAPSYFTATLLSITRYLDMSLVRALLVALAMVYSASAKRILIWYVGNARSLYSG